MSPYHSLLGRPDSEKRRLLPATSILLFSERISVTATTSEGQIGLRPIASTALFRISFFQIRLPIAKIELKPTPVPIPTFFSLAFLLDFLYIPLRDTPSFLSGVSPIPPCVTIWQFAEVVISLSALSSEANE